MVKRAALALGAALILAPGFAAGATHKVVKSKVVKSKVVKKAAKTVVKPKTAATLKPTVAFHEEPNAPAPKTPVVAPGPPAATTPTDLDKQKATEQKIHDLDGKLAKDIREHKNVKDTLTQYDQFLDANQDYKYAGDVYMRLYNVSVQQHMDVLQQLKFAGKAADELKAGRSARGANQQLIDRYSGVEDKLIDQWIQTEIRKAMQEAGK